ncbi:MAG: AMP-binding protein [Microcoleaceae cyanobacterium]
MANSLINKILESVHKNPSKVVMIFMGNDGSEELITGEVWYQEVITTANILYENGVRKQDVVLLALPHSRALLGVFWAAMYLGAIPSIFPYPMSFSKLGNYPELIQTLVKNSGVKTIATTEKLSNDLKSTNLSSQVIVFENEISSFSALSTKPLAQPALGAEIAYLQHTSGTTGLQKGVLISESSIKNFVASFSQALTLNSEDVIINWLPLYHDFGLFAGLVMPFVLGIPTIIMSPFKWMRRPKSLFQAIDKYRATIYWTTNFGYHHCVNHVHDKDLNGIDLSHLKAVVSGGEPIRHHSQKLFFDKFAPYGLSLNALVAGYGMAENTLAVSVGYNSTNFVDWIDPQKSQDTGIASPEAENSSNAIPVVSCGLPLPGVDIAIVNQNHSLLSERNIGEVIFRSPFLFSGYHNRPDLTNKVLRDGWFYSGDIGYMANGHLYIFGRKKDLIIVDGKNIYPEDLEGIAQNTPGIVAGGIVAFAISNYKLSTEQIIIICELQKSVQEEQRQNIELEIRKEIKQKLGVILNEIHLVKKGWIVKTNNGKISRKDNRNKYQLQLSNT